jgi:Xaa-Pro aminopeptidase
MDFVRSFLPAYIIGPVPASEEVEAKRAASLLEAQDKAFQLFKDIEKELVRPGVSEQKMDEEIAEIAEKRYGVKKHWHKRLVRSGPHTLLPFAEKAEDRTIEEGDILYVDLGPVFEKWEADFGRTFVLGDDLEKIKLRDALEPTFNNIKARYKQNPDITGEELFRIAKEEGEKAGYAWGAHLAGHIIGDYPHERIPKNEIHLYIVEGCKAKLSSRDKKGNKRHWILEVHLRNPELNIQGFYEQLLTVD